MPRHAPCILRLSSPVQCRQRPETRGADRAAPGAALLPVRRRHPRCGAAGGPRILTGQWSGAGHRPGGRRASRGRRRLAHGAHQSVTPGGRPLRGAAARVRAGVVWSAAARRSGVRGADPARHGRGRARPRRRRPAAFESRFATGELPLDRAGRRRRRSSPRGHHRAPAGTAFPSPAGLHDLDLLSATLVPGEAFTIPDSGAKNVVLITDGAANVGRPGGEAVVLLAGEAASFSGELQVSAASDGGEAQDVSFVVAMIGPEVPPVAASRRRRPHRRRSRRRPLHRPQARRRRLHRGDGRRGNAGDGRTGIDHRPGLLLPARHVPPRPSPPRPARRPSRTSTSSSPASR